jgi:hypothetical protein
MNTSVTSLEEINQLQIKTMRRHPDWDLDPDAEYLFQCDACEQYKREENMHSHDWCKNCYKYFLKCHFQGMRFVPWKWRYDLHDKY